MGKEDEIKPTEFFSRETGDLPFDVSPTKGYSLITPEGAKKRSWGKTKGPDPHRVKDWVQIATAEIHHATVSEVEEKIVDQFGEVEKKSVNDAISKAVQDKRLYYYKGKKDQTEKPELIAGTSATFYIPDPDDILITPAKAAEKGWLGDIKDRGVHLTGKGGAEKLLSILRRIGSLYQRGGKSKIDLLDLTEMMIPTGGTLRITLQNAPPETIKNLGELFEVIDGLVETGDQTEGYLDINHPESDCPFVEELKKDTK